ncbi:hypothetical protein LINPERHAP1_LOCUS14334, partial [Linum perenne]
GIGKIKILLKRVELLRFNRKLVIKLIKVQGLKRFG